MRPPLSLRLAAVAFLTVGTSGCATLQQIAALRNVDFDLDRVSDLRLAGVDMRRIDSYDDLSLAEIARLTLAISREELPLDFRVHITGENPPENSVDARMVRMDWTLLLENRETVSGVFNDEVLFPAGQPNTFPISVSLDLLEFFDGGAKDLFELALSVAGAGGAPKNVALRATPVIDTPLGGIRYPSPITIVNREVGGR